MNLRRYYPEEFDHVLELFNSRNEKINKQALPPIGFVTDNAACFLITTSSQICFIEFLVARPVQSRDRELDAVVQACLDVGSAMGYKICYALTEKTSVVERALKHSFKVQKQKVLLGRGF
jgi:hypothetical protein